MGPAQNRSPMVCTRYLIKGLALLLICTQGFTQTDRTVTVNLTAKDHFSERPLESARAILYYRGQELGSVLTNAQGQASLVHTITGVEDFPDQPHALALGRSYPNPFTGNTRVPLSVGEPQTVRARVINLLGAEMASLQQFLEPGTHTIQLSLGSLPHGIYFLTVKGIEHSTIRLVKTGGGGQQAAQAISFHTISHLPAGLPDAATDKSGDDKIHMPDYAIEVSKDNYSTKTLMTALTQDTTMLFPMKRINRVAFASADEDGDAHETEILIRGDYFHQLITTPDTLLMHAGSYTVSSSMPFIKPFEQVFEVEDSDKVVQVEVEKMDAMIYEHADPESDLLFISEHVDGYTFYYHGLKETSKQAAKHNVEYEVMHLTHFVLDYGDGTRVILIYNEELYPIMWVADYYVISVRKPRHQAFNPARAWITVFADEDTKALPASVQAGSWYEPGGRAAPDYLPAASTNGCRPADGRLLTSDPTLELLAEAKRREDTLTVDIRVGNLFELVSWLEAETGQSLDMARYFLNNVTSSWDTIRQRARRAGPQQGDYLRLAAAFSVAASAKAYTDAMEPGASKPGAALAGLMGGGKLPYSPFPPLSPPTLPGVGAGAVGCALNAAVERANTDRSGVTVPIYVCRGATAWSNICQNAVFTGPVSRCVSRCPASMDCFVDICAPDVMNIQRVLQVRERQ